VLATALPWVVGNPGGVPRGFAALANVSFTC
jgi:hypothetical protein